MTEERVFPVRNPEIVAREQAAYSAKIEKNKAEGLQKLLSGEYPLFKGWSVETSGRTFDTILQLDEPSQKRIIERVVKPLHKLAQVHNIPAMYPGIGDGPPHVVLQPGKFTNLNTEQIETIKKYLASNKSHLNLLARIVEGLTFHHDTLVITAHTSYICASQFDAEQGGAFRARKALERIIAHASGHLKPNSQQPVEGTFTPNDYHDIFHSSVMRFTGRASATDLAVFIQDAYSKIGEDLKSDPVPVTVSNLYRGIASDYQRKYVPDLVITQQS